MSLPGQRLRQVTHLGHSIQGGPQVQVRPLRLHDPESVFPFIVSPNSSLAHPSPSPSPGHYQVTFWWVSLQSTFLKNIILCFVYFSELHLATTWPHPTESIIVDNNVYLGVC